MNRTLLALHSSAIFCKYPFGGMMTPPSPWMGSTSTAAVLGVIALPSALASPKGTLIKPGVNGPKSSLYRGSVEKDTVVIVLPWKFPAQVMISAWYFGTFFTG